MNEEEVIEFLVSLQPRWSDFTQYCIRGISEKFCVTDTKATKIYRKLIDSGKIEKIWFDMDSSLDPQDHWGGGFGRMRTTYWKIKKK